MSSRASKPPRRSPAGTVDLEHQHTSSHPLSRGLHFKGALGWGLASAHGTEVSRQKVERGARQQKGV